MIACYEGYEVIESLVYGRSPRAKFTMHGPKGSCTVICIVSWDLFDLVEAGDPIIIDSMAKMAITEYEETDPPAVHNTGRLFSVSGKDPA